jgi:hypothetical protein
LSTIHLNELVEDDISWRLTSNGQYSAKSAYEVQFLGLIKSPMYDTVWKAWAPPKTKFFAWLVTQNRVWTADRLAKRGWPNCGLCPLCKQCVESVNHLFIHCRFTKRLWALVVSWLGISGVDTSLWVRLSMKAWWNGMAARGAPNRKAMSTLTLRITWEIWCERNTRVFRNKQAPAQVVF